ncbi:MAG TPA: hypothetical protein VFM18_24185 [Methanosarcina sp.]|nr:hypothetical protein [Methanosarcina sp.]
MAYCRFSNSCNVYMYAHVLGGYQFHLPYVKNGSSDFRIESATEAL